jgi:hypothetical protein
MTHFQKNRFAVRLFSGLMKISAWLQDIPNKVTPPPFRLIQIGSAFWQSRALYVAARLNIATILADGTLTADEIATRVSAHADASHRLLRMLAAMGVFEESAPRRFRNNRLSTFLREDNPRNVRAMILMHNSEEMTRPWYEQFEHGVKSGAVPFRLAHGEELFAYMDMHPAFDALFSRAMDSVEALTGDSFVTDFNWGRFGRVIDIGGSKGAKSLAILKRYPGLVALVVDRDPVIRAAREYWKGKADEASLARLNFEAGDLLTSAPAARSGDIFLLSAVLHGFDDDTCVRALRNLAAASAGTGVPIALLEVVLDEPGADMTGAMFDMQMFMGTRGRERTLREWLKLFDRSGLALEELVSLRSFGKILVLKGLPRAAT